MGISTLAEHALNDDERPFVLMRCQETAHSFLRWNTRILHSRKNPSPSWKSITSDVGRRHGDEAVLALQRRKTRDVRTLRTRALRAPPTIVKYLPFPEHPFPENYPPPEAKLDPKMLTITQTLP